MIRLLTPNPQKKHIDRSSIVMKAKYQKLHRYSQRIFPSNKAMSILRTVFFFFSEKYQILDFLILETVSAFRDSCAYEQNNTATPFPDTYIVSIFQAIKCWKSLINSMSLLPFSAIVAVEEVEVGRRQVPKVDFRECQ